MVFFILRCITFLLLLISPCFIHWLNCPVKVFLLRALLWMTGNLIIQVMMLAKWSAMTRLIWPADYLLGLLLSIIANWLPYLIVLLLYFEDLITRLFIDLQRHSNSNSSSIQNSYYARFTLIRGTNKIYESWKPKMVENMNSIDIDKLRVKKHRMVTWNWKWWKKPCRARLGLLAASRWRGRVRRRCYPPNSRRLSTSSCCRQPSSPETRVFKSLGLFGVAEEAKWKSVGKKKSSVWLGFCGFRLEILADEYK